MCTAAPQQHIKAVKDVIREFYGKTVTTDDQDSLMRDYRNYATTKKAAIEEVLRDDYGVNSKLPGKKILEKALRLIDETLKISDPISFYKRVDELCDDFIEVGLDIGDLNSFLGGVQKDKFLHAVKVLGIYENSKNYISDQEIIDYAAEVKKILSVEKPYSFIPKLLGTPDLDAISICKTENYALISFEIFLVELNLLAGNKSITPLAYINSIEKDDSGLIGYLNKMVQFHMMNILNKDIYERIAKSTASGITEEWNQYIGMIDQQDSNYKNWIKEHFALVGQKYQQNRGEDQTINDIEKIFTVELYKLLEREVHYSMDTLHDEKGNLVIRTYMRVFDKKEQKYIEGLDQIIDSVFQIDFSDEQ